MNTPQTCQQCGSTMTPAAGSPFGDQPVCPICLLGLGMSDQQATLAGPTAASAQFVRSKAKHQIPDVDQLMGKFPNLEIQHLIGHGGMGAVYQARQTSLDRTVALKILSPRLSNDEAFAQRFMREAKTLARLAHPNIVMVFEFGQTDQMHYLLMEHVDGINLRDAIVEGKLTASEALTIVPQICDALQYAHDEGVVHRDIKPENILIDKKGRVKIADFGLAKLLQPNADDYQLTGTQQVLGTLNYMAPEQIEGRANIDHRADIYSLGVVFYELLTGELPIGRFAVPSEKGKSNSNLDNVVLRTLEKEPNRRYQNASDVKTAVQNASMQGLPTHMQIASPSGVELVSDGPIPNQLNPQSDRVMQMAANDLRAQAPGKPEPTAAPFQSPMPNLGKFNRPLGLDLVPQTTASSADRSIAKVSVPFTIDQVYAGFAMAYGIITIDHYGLEIEFEVRDEVLKTIKSKSKNVRIPHDALVSLEHKKGVFSDQILVHTNSLAACSDVPNSNSGNFKINVKKIHRDQAQMLANFAKSVINPTHQAPGSLPPSKTPFQSAQVAPDSWAGFLDNFAWVRYWQPQVSKINPIKVSARFSSIRFWFITCGVLNFVLMGGSLRRIIHNSLVENLEQHQRSFLYPLVMWLQSFDLVANPFSDSFANGWSGWVVPFSITLFVASGKLDELKSYIFVCLICAWALIPFYPTYLLCAPWALWGLLIMLMPSTISTFDFVGEDGSLQLQPLDKNGKPIDDSGEGILSHRSQTFISRFLFAWIVLGLSLLITSGLVYSKILSASGNMSSVTKLKEAPDSSEPQKETSQSSDGENPAHNSASESQSAPTTVQEGEENSQAVAQPNSETPKPPTAPKTVPEPKDPEPKNPEANTDIDDQNLSVDSLGIKASYKL